MLIDKQGNKIRDHVPPGFLHLVRNHLVVDLEVFKSNILNPLSLVITQNQRWVDDFGVTRAQRKVFESDISNRSPRSRTPHLIMHHSDIEQLAAGDPFHPDILCMDILDEV